MKRWLILPLVFIMVLSMCACAGGGQGSGMSVEDMQNNLDEIQRVADENGITTVDGYPFDASRASTANTDERYPYVEFAQSMSPKEWQPYNLADSAKSYGKWMVYEFLFDRVSADEYEGRIAKSYVQEDDTHYLIEIYDYVKDSAGNAITASDVAFSYELNAKSGYAEKFEIYESAEAVDTYTVRITLNAPISTLDGFYYLFANVAIVSEAAYDENIFSKSPIGTGPYVLTEFITDSYCEFEARDDYWQTGELRSDLAKANAQTIRIDFVTDSSMRMIMLENGSSVCNPYLAATDIDAFLTGGEYEGQFNLTTFYNTQSTTLLANCSEDSIMSDINMRLACWYAIDTPSLVTALGANANSGCIVDASTAIGDYQDSWNDIESYQTEYSIEKSKEYQALAGYNGETIKILAGTFTTKKNTAQIVSEMLRQAGINTEITVVEYVVEEQTLHDSTGWDLYTTSQLDNDYTITRIYNCYSTEATWAENGVSKSFIDDPVLQEMINGCCSVDNYNVEKTGEILQYIIDNAYGYATTFQTSYVAWSKVVAKATSYYGRPEYPLLNACDYYLDGE